MNAWQLHPQLADDTAPVIELPLCEVRLMDDANHPWLVLVPRVAEMIEIIDLDPARRLRLAAEIDIAWPRPVWGVANARPYGPEELIERVNALRAALAR